MSSRLGPIHRVAHPEPEIRRYLVVSRARGVQPPGGGADAFGEPRLDVEVDVLQLGLELEIAALDFRLHLVEPLEDRATVGVGNDLLAHQHRAVRLGRRDVLGVKPLVKVDRGVDPLHQLVGADGEAPAPHLVGCAGALGCFFGAHGKMTRKTGVLIIVLLVALAAGFAVVRFRNGPEIQANPPVKGAMKDFTVSRERKPAPATRLIAADGKVLSLAAFRDRIVVVNFWATWCAPCVKEMPSLQRLRALLSADQVAIVALSEDLKGWPVIAPFLEKWNLNALPVYFDPEASVGTAMGATNLPTTVILDRDGREAGRLVGPAEWDSDEAVALVRHYIGRN